MHCLDTQNKLIKPSLAILQVYLISFVPFISLLCISFFIYFLYLLSLFYLSLSLFVSFFISISFLYLFMSVLLLSLYFFISFSSISLSLSLFQLLPPTSTLLTLNIFINTLKYRDSFHQALFEALLQQQAERAPPLLHFPCENQRQISVNHLLLISMPRSTWSLRSLIERANALIVMMERR